MSAESARQRPRPRTLAMAALAAVVAVAALPAAWSAGANAPSPGTFVGYGFDACQAPTASTMDAWLSDPSNPYRAIGIYISGGMRGCSQPNLTNSWVGHTQQTGWHLIPITVGPQASCSQWATTPPDYTRTVNSDPANVYLAARQQGANEADSAANVAASLGISQSSTLFYDMEGWHTGYTDCDASTLWFLSGWSNRLHARGYAAGVYSSGGSGIALLNQTANNRPPGFVLPDQLWFAQWYNQPCPDATNTDTSYISAGNWNQHQRIRQYCGGHNATNGGITLNIDSNFLDVQTVSPIAPPIPGPGDTPVTSTPSAVHSVPVTSIPNNIQPPPASVSPSVTAAVKPAPTVAPSTAAPASPAPASSAPASSAPASPSASTSPLAAAAPVVTKAKAVQPAPPTTPTPPTATGSSVGIKPPSSAGAPELPKAQQQPLKLETVHPKPVAPKPSAPAAVVASAAPVVAPPADTAVQAPATVQQQPAPLAPTNPFALTKPADRTATDQAISVAQTIGKAVVDVISPAVGWLSRMVGSLFS